MKAVERLQGRFVPCQNKAHRHSMRQLHCAKQRVLVMVASERHIITSAGTLVCATIVEMNPYFVFFLLMFIDIYRGSGSDPARVGRSVERGDVVRQLAMRAPIRMRYFSTARTFQLSPDFEVATPHGRKTAFRFLNLRELRLRVRFAWTSARVGNRPE